MNVCSAGFLLLCCLGPVLFHLCRTARLRRFFLSLLNAGFLVCLISDARSWLYLVIFIAVSYAVIRSLTSASSPGFIGWVIGGFIAVFIYVKNYAFLALLFPVSVLHKPIALVGLSYMLFKAIHVFVDRWQGTLAPCSFLSYANYQLAFFTIIAGPIQRYNDFYLHWEKCDLPEAESSPILHQAWHRILTGMLKVGGLSSLAWYAFDRGVAAMSGPPQDFGLLDACLVFYGYPVYLYFNFSGYTDVMIGAARLYGFQLPENFNHPYLARNMLDFWNRWHMTLTHWIRDYIFMTSYKAVVERMAPQAKVIGYFLLFASLLIAGFWHGSESGFAIFGLIHGVGVAFNQFCTDRLKSARGAAGLKCYQQNQFYRVLAMIATGHYVCFSMLFFSLQTEGALAFFRSVYRSFSPPWIGGTALVLAFWCADVVLLLFLLSRRSLVERWTAFTVWLEEAAAGRYAFLVVECVLVATLLFFYWAFEQAEPQVVYMQF